MFDKRNLFQYSNFYCTLFSIHRPYNFTELKGYSDVLKWGGCAYSFYDPNLSTSFRCSVGLAFNKHIIWNDKLFEISKFDCDPYQASYFEEELFPLDKKKEIESYQNVLNSALSLSSTPAKDFMDSPDMSDWFERDYTNVSNNIEDYILDFEKGKVYLNAVLLSESFYNNVMEQILTQNKRFKVTSFLDFID